MAEIICERCQARDDVKNAVVRGVQRYRCRVCGGNFTATKHAANRRRLKRWRRCSTLGAI
jgi:transposase-like protein